MYTQQFIKKILVVVLGTMLMSIGLNLFIFSGQGVDPLSTFLDGVVQHIPLELGTMISIFNTIVLVTVFFVDRRHIGVGSFINGIFTGVFSNMLMAPMAPLQGMPTVVLVLLGVVIFSLGIAVYMSAMFGLGSMESTMLIFTSRTGFDATIVRTVMDVAFIIVGILLGATFGYGSILSAAFNGKLIGIFSGWISKFSQPK